MFTQTIFNKLKPAHRGLRGKQAGFQEDERSSALLEQTFDDDDLRKQN